MGFVRATRKRSFIKINVCGPEGSGKTMSALKLAQGLVGEGPQLTVAEGKVAVLDTENGSASLYANLFPFDVQELAPPFRPENYIQIIQEAQRAGYEVLVIDSTSHEWAGTGGLLDDKGKLDAKNNNSFGNFRDITPRHELFLDAILQAKMHIVCTTRSKTEYVMGEGKSNVKKLGMAPIQREGFNYLFTTVFEVSDKHEAFLAKDRTGLFQEIVGTIVPDMGRDIRQWLESGGEPDPEPAAAPAPAPTATSTDKERNNLLSAFVDIARQNDLIERITTDGKPSRTKMYDLISLVLDAEPFGKEEAPTLEEIGQAIEALPAFARSKARTEAKPADKPEKQDKFPPKTPAPAPAAAKPADAPAAPAAAPAPKPKEEELPERLRDMEDPFEEDTIPTTLELGASAVPARPLSPKGAI